MKKFLIVSLLAIGIFGFVGANVASAITPEQTAEKQNFMFEHKAEVFGISVEQAKEYWAEKGSMWKMTAEMGIDKAEMRERIKENREARMQEHMQAMIDDGVMTQEQVDQRLQEIEARVEQKRAENKGTTDLGRAYSK